MEAADRPPSPSRLEEGDFLLCFGTSGQNDPGVRLRARVRSWARARVRARVRLARALHFALVLALVLAPARALTPTPTYP